MTAGDDGTSTLSEETPDEHSTGAAWSTSRSPNARAGAGSDPLVTCSSASATPTTPRCATRSPPDGSPPRPAFRRSIERQRGPGGQPRQQVHEERDRDRDPFPTGHGVGV